MYSNELDMCEVLKNNTYPGRGILLGTMPDGSALAVYFIMGRSENSRNRIFLHEGDNLRIDPFDPSKVEDISLIVYYPVRKYENSLIVTNGNKTDTIYNYLKDGKCFINALETRCFEPDAPHFTPRISGIINLDKGNYSLSILKKQDDEGKVCQRQYFKYNPVPGTARFIHTYASDGKILPSYYGEPKLIRVPDDFEKYVNKIWENLNEDNKISLYAYSNNKTIIINRHNK